jgi:hypothetical protein
MIHKLLHIILTRLRENLADAFHATPDTVAQHIAPGPVIPPSPPVLPYIALSWGKFTINQHTPDSLTSQPRPQPVSQRMAVDAANPHGPYGLAHTPLAGSMQGVVIQEPGTLAEQRVVLVEGKDFTIAYPQATLTLTPAFAPASQILLSYTFAGIFTLREFLQDLVIDIYDTTMAAVEQWASLTTGLLLTSHNDLLAAYNADVPASPADLTNTYRSGQVVTTHTITQIKLLEGLPSLAATPCHLQLRWTVAGQLKLVREQVEGVGIIEQIVSPGRPPTTGVAIDVQLGQAPQRR